MTAVAEPTKKKASKKAATSTVETLDNGTIVVTTEGAEVAINGEAPKSHTRVPSKKPGEPGFDWKSEYPDEDDVYVYTSPAGLTIGLVALGPKRKPKPGLLRRLHREGGMSVMWYFIELASSDASLKLQEELDEEEYTEMLRGWAEFAGIELSE